MARLLAEAGGARGCHAPSLSGLDLAACLPLRLVHLAKRRHLGSTSSGVSCRLGITTRELTGNTDAPPPCTRAVRLQSRPHFSVLAAA